MAYTSIIQPADLNNIIYPEIITKITRNDGGALATQAIATGIDEVKMYLSRYDLIQLFGDQVANVPAIFTSPLLLQLCKYISLWHLIQLANPNINYESVKLLYDQSIDTLKRIQKGMADPKWPYMDTTGEDAPQSDQVTIIPAPDPDHFFY